MFAPASLSPNGQSPRLKYWQTDWTKVESKVASINRSAKWTHHGAGRLEGWRWWLGSWFARLRGPAGDEDSQTRHSRSVIHNCNVVLLLHNTSWNKIFQKLIITNTRSHPPFASVSSGTVTMNPPSPTSLIIIESATGFNHVNQRDNLITPLGLPLLTSAWR